MDGHRPDPLGEPSGAFAALSSLQLSGRPLSQTLGRIAELAHQMLPGTAAASVTLIRAGVVHSLGVSGPVAASLDERQYETGFGPCLDAARSGVTVAIDDTTATGGRYADFADLARRLGITHTLSLALPVRQRTIGSLNVYGTGAHGFDDRARRAAMAFAGYAAVAVADADADALADASAQVRHLHRALETRGVIEQAKGILMVRHGLTADAAFALLATASQNSNRKLRDIAADVVAEAQPGGPAG